MSGMGQGKPETGVMTECNFQIIKKWMKLEKSKMKKVQERQYLKPGEVETRSIWSKMEIGWGEAQELNGHL
jgi:hypothetical protein